MLTISSADALMLLELNRGVPVEQVDNINYILLSQLIDKGMGSYYPTMLILKRYVLVFRHPLEILPRIE